MKKIIVLFLSAVVLFTAMPNQVNAEADCDHSEVNLDFKKSVRYSHTHYYTTKNGKPAGCIVTIVQDYCVKTCRNCGCYIQTIYLNGPHEEHEHPNHDD